MEIIFPDFKKVKTLSESDDYGNVVKSYELTYGVDEQRRKSVFKENGTSKETRYYLGSYEEKTDHATGIIEKIHYLSDAVYITRSDGSSDFYYVYTDHLGSLTALTGERGDVTV